MSLLKKIIKVIQNHIFDLISQTKSSKFRSLFNFYIRVMTKNNFNLRCELHKSLYKFNDSTGEIFLTQPKRSAYLLGSIEHRLNKLFEEYMLHDVNFEDNDIVVDCGANIGELYLSIKKRENNNFNYYGYEPSEKDFRALKLNTNNLVKSNYALFEREENKVIYLNEENADNSLSLIDNVTSEDEIQAIPLDKVKELENKKIKLLKLEAEGDELSVLKGAKNILKNIKFISADLGFEKYDADNENYISTLAPVAKYLNNHNFELINTYRLTRKTFLFENKKI